MVWINQHLDVYHGTLDGAASQIAANGVDRRRCRLRSDFGQGFYVTTSLHQARQWANMSYMKAQSAVRHISRAAVLHFKVDRDRLGDLNDHLAFVLPSPDFYDFVRYNRLGGANHSRTVNRPYDLVYGPVVAYPQTIVLASCDQLCFLTDRALRTLGKPDPNFATGNPLFP